MIHYTPSEMSFSRRVLICELIQYALKTPLDRLQNKCQTATTEETNRKRPLWWNLQTVPYNRPDLDFRNSRRQKVKVEQFEIDIYSNNSLVRFPTTLLILEAGQPSCSFKCFVFHEHEFIDWSFKLVISYKYYNYLGPILLMWNCGLN